MFQRRSFLQGHCGIGWVVGKIIMSITPSSTPRLCRLILVYFSTLAMRDIIPHPLLSSLCYDIWIIIKYCKQSQKICTHREFELRAATEEALVFKWFWWFPLSSFRIGGANACAHSLRCSYRVSRSETMPDMPHLWSYLSLMRCLVTYAMQCCHWCSCRHHVLSLAALCGQLMHAFYGGGACMYDWSSPIFSIDALDV